MFIFILVFSLHICIYIYVCIYIYIYIYIYIFTYINSHYGNKNNKCLIACFFLTKYESLCCVDLTTVPSKVSFTEALSENVDTFFSEFSVRPEKNAAIQRRIYVQ